MTRLAHACFLECGLTVLALFCVDLFLDSFRDGPLDLVVRGLWALLALGACVALPTSLYCAVRLWRQPVVLGLGIAPLLVLAVLLATDFDGMAVFVTLMTYGALTTVLGASGLLCRGRARA